MQFALLIVEVRLKSICSSQIKLEKMNNDEIINVQSHPLQIVLDNIVTKKWDDIRLGMAILIARGRGLL